MLFAAVAAAQPAAAAELPIVCTAGACGAGGPSSWVSSGSATGSVTGNTFNVHQTSDRAILNWASFNVSADGRVIFQQPSSTSIALNRIYDARPSRIFGQVQANGEIYLVNPNGIIFGKTAVINAAGILASTLQISDETFTAGIASPSNLGRNNPAALEADSRANNMYVLGSDGEPLRGHIDADGNLVADPQGELIKVRLSTQEGAQLTTSGSNGRILLASQEIDNAGKLTAASGQVILAAGEKVYLQASGDSQLRGLLVEVDVGGKVWNRSTGEISTPRGNTTLVGLAVNQSGRISATTTVSANGSIRLLARDTTVIDGQGTDGATLRATRTGTLEFGSQSATSVTPELGDTEKAADEQTQFPSRIEAMGRQVSIRSNAVIRAPGGRLEVSALRDPSGRAPGVVDPDSQLRIESGAVIDLAGSEETLPMSRNLVTVELRGSELADSPNQRNGALRGTAVVVDARIGTPLGDVSGALRNIGKSVAERTSEGGTAVFTSDGDIVAATGSSFDVSGGAIQYRSGVIQTSQLIGANGNVYDIGSADPSRTYVGVINPVYRRVDDRWGQIDIIAAPGFGRLEPGYSEGRSAGTLQFVAPTLVLNGNFVGRATAGPNQRNLASLPQGGRFIVGLAEGLGLAPNLDYGAPSIDLTATAPNIVVADGAALPSGLRLQLPTDYLRNGFTRTELYSNGEITVPQDNPLQLAPGSSFIAQGRRIDVLADISSPGGSIALTSHDTIGNAVRNDGIGIGEGVTLDVRGTWTNDYLLDPATRPTDPTLFNGGSISLALAGSGLSGDQELVLADGVQLRASAGAHVARNGSVTAGRGGSISLRTTGYRSAIEVGEGVAMDAFGVLGASGGTFRLEAPRIAVANGSSWAPPQSYRSDVEGFFNIGTGLFADHGFSTVSLTANGARSEENGNTLQVLPGTQLRAQVSSLQLDADAARTRTSGGGIAGFSNVVLPLPHQRASSDITLATALSVEIPGSTSAQAGDLSVSAGAVLQGDARSRFSFSSLGSLFLDGTIVAPGGTITAGLATPRPEQDAGYLQEQRLQVGSTATLDVSGTPLFMPNDLGLTLGEVLAGGTVNLLSNRGSVVVDGGSRIDISGTAASLDVATGITARPYERHVVASSAGALNVRAPESIGLYGQVDAAAGSGDVGEAAAGALSVELTRNAGWGATSDVFETFPVTPRRIEVSVGELAGSGVQENGVARISQGFIERAGFDSLTLRADDEISIRAGTSLSLARQLSLDTAQLSVAGNGEVTLAASYVSIGNSLRADSAATPAAGAGTLNVQAGEFIDLIGSTVLSSMSSATLTSGGDIRLRGTVREDASSRGDLRIAGDLTLSAARIYGATDTQFALRASGGENDRIEIRQNGVSPGTPLSVASSLTLSAREIVQGGTLLAPFGSISLQGQDSVSLLANSVTSVSGAGTLFPYGKVTVGQWNYQAAAAALVGRPIDALPTRQISISADSTAIAPGATVDLRGGGDLYAYEWVPGTGGTKDALAPGVTPGLYAILPGLAGQYAPYDPQEYANSELRPGDSVYLSGIEGLPAGTYALLPARYALLPGAFLVSAVPGTTGIVPGSVASLNDGTVVTAGYRTFGNTQLGNTQYSGFAVRPGSYGRALAAYDDFRASSFFAARAERLELGRVDLPADAASLSLFAGTTLDARGSVLTAAADGGRGASIDISALRLAVVGSDSSGAGDAVEVSADQIVAWNPSRLVLGARHGAGGELAVTADEVSIRDGVSLALDEVVIAARDRISMEAGSHVGSRSGANGASAPTLADAAAVLQLSNDDSGAAFMAVSDVQQLLVERGSSPTRRGAIDIAAGASLASRGAITIDAPSGGEIAGDLRADAARVSLGADRLVFGAERLNDALVIDSALQSQLQAATALRFAANQSLDFLRDVTFDLSARASSSIELNTPRVDATGAAVAVSLSAHEVRLGGGAASQSPAPTGGAGTLTLTGDRIVLGAGAMDVAGFGKSTWTADQRIVGTGAGQFRVGGDLDLNAPLVTIASDGDTRIDAAGGTVRLLATGTAPDLSALGLGGSLQVTGQRIESSTAIVAPSGLVTLSATEDLSLTNGASIDAAGREVFAGGRSVGSPGGTIRLEAGGNLTTATGSRLDVSGAGDSGAGRLSLRADGTATVAGTLSALAAGGATGGSFDLYAQVLGNFDALNAQLQQGGFSKAQRVRVGTGDLELAAGGQVTSQSVEWIADAGSVRVGGTISAISNDTRGSIRLYGANGVALTGTGQLRTDAAPGQRRGGDIELGTSAGSIDLAPGSVISAEGSALDGTLVLRAPTLGNDMAIDRLAANLSNVDTVALAPILGFDLLTAAPLAADLTAIRDSVGAFVDAAEATMMQRLISSSARSIVLRPDIELRRDGDLTLDSFNLLSSLNLADWRFGSQLQPGSLTVRASGSLQVNTVLSDGFVASGAGVNARLDLLAGPSSSISLTAGADLASVDPNATRFGAAGDLTLGPSAVVRTGTGTISLNAAQDVVFGTSASVYTGGVAGTASQTLLIATGRSALATFPDQGGSINVHAGRDVRGSAAPQSVSTWQLRGIRSATNQPFARLYGINAVRFGWNVGTLGGGDLQVSAGRDVRDLSAATADSAVVRSDQSVDRYGGGSMSVMAGNDIASSMVYGGQNTLSLHADGALTSDRTADNGRPLGTVLALGNTRALVEARRDILLERVFDPGVLWPTGVANARQSFFWTYGENSSLTVQSTAGDARLFAGSQNGLPAFVEEEVTAGSLQLEAFSVYPSTLSARAFTNDVVLDDRVYMAPADNGQLDLFAARDIRATESNAGISMSDGAVDGVPTLLQPVGSQGDALSEVLKFGSGSRHLLDDAPALVTAGRDIVGGTFSMAKAARYVAGRDVFDVTINGQNLRATDTTLISAGRDVAYSVGSQQGEISIGGPGQLVVLAGRDVDLGFSGGITTTGRLRNPSLPTADGASITVAAGLAADVDYLGFIDRIIAPSGDYRQQVVDYIAATTGKQLEFDDALAELRKLDADAQRPLVDAVFFAELVQSGREANTTPGTGFVRGYAAIDALFPNSRSEENGGTQNKLSDSPYRGDINMEFSRIYTLQGGDISLLIPGGLLNVGLANPPPLVQSRPPSRLGIVAQRAGSVNVFAHGDVLVNSSRIFTLLGGDIAVWSTQGNIDAGRGAKSSLSAPPPTVTVSRAGVVTLDFSGAVAGSGIRTILTGENVRAGDVDLIAPVGFVDAGDAGIGSAGNLNIAARQVIGVGNIQVGGNATGVPPEASGLGASLSGVSAVANSASSASSAAVEDGAGNNQQSAPMAQDALSWLEVFVVGLGEEGCKQDDVACLKRQKID